MGLAIAGLPLRDGDLGFDEVVELEQVQAFVSAAVVERFDVAMGWTYATALAGGAIWPYKTELLEPRRPLNGLNDLEIATAGLVDSSNHRRAIDYCDDLTPSKHCRLTTLTNRPQQPLEPPTRKTPDSPGAVTRQKPGEMAKTRYAKASSSSANLRRPSTLYDRLGKRVFDVLGASIVAVLTLPLQAVLAVLIRKDLGSPVLFRQVRPGRHGRPFEMVKFRTMTDERDTSGELLPDADRLPPFGRFLRSTSLDELPELFNVIKGDMSLVGPRPLLTRYLSRYSPRQARRHEVRPGMTGWAQVNGRNNQSWESKLEQDVFYVDNVSLGLDLRILARTVVSVIRRADVQTEGHATAPEFQGSPAVGDPTST